MLFAMGCGVLVGIEVSRQPLVVIKMPDWPTIPVVVVKVPVLVERVKVQREVRYVYLPAGDFNFFEDEGELDEWLALNWVDDMGSLMCVSETLELVRRARRDNYYMSADALFRGPSERKYEDWHMVASTLIGRDLYYIEPVDRYKWKAGHSATPIERM